MYISLYTNHEKVEQHEISMRRPNNMKLADRSDFQVLVFLLPIVQIKA